MSFIETTKGAALFKRYLAKFKGKSSQKVYRSEIRQFFLFFDGDIKQLSRRVFVQYREHLAQSVGDKTIKRKFSILNQFFKFLEKNLKGFQSPVGQNYGDMRSFQARDYAKSESFKELLDKWKETLICDTTKKTYLGQVRLFFKWSGKEPKDLRQEEFMRYRDHLLVEEKLKASTIWNKFIALNGFLKFMGIRSRKFKNPMDFGALALTPAKKDKGYYSVLTKKEANKMLRQPDRRQLIGKRDYAILRLMLTYGLRAGEICRLTHKDLDQERVKNQQRIWIRDRKGRIGRRADTDIILNGKALEAFDDWMKHCGIRFDPGTPVFAGFIWSLSAGGLAINYQRVLDKKPLTVKTIENVVSRYVAKAGIETRDRVLSPHALRHTALTLLAKAGSTLVDLKQLAGHQDINTTMIYLHSVQSFDDHLGMHNPLNQ